MLAACCCKRLNLYGNNWDWLGWAFVSGFSFFQAMDTGLEKFFCRQSDFSRIFNYESKINYLMRQS